MTNAMDKLLTVALEENHFALSHHTKEQLLAYLEILNTWNRIYNLTAITKPRDIIYLHLIDSLSVKPYLQGENILDVGTGGGFPGMPLAIVDPTIQFVLLDKNSKKIRFLRQVIAELHLTNVVAIHARCEDFHPEACFDTILARALGKIRLFVELTQHLSCPSGILIAMKGKYPDTEMSDLPKTVEVQQTVAVHIQGTDVERHLICLRKKS